MRRNIAGVFYEDPCEPLAEFPVAYLAVQEQLPYISCVYKNTAQDLQWSLTGGKFLPIAKLKFHEKKGNVALRRVQPLKER